MLNSVISFMSNYDDNTIKEYANQSSIIKKRSSKDVYDLAETFFSFNKMVFTFNGFFTNILPKLSINFIPIKPNYLNQKKIYLILIYAFTNLIYERIDFLLKKINITFNNPLVEKISKYVTPIIAITGSNLAIFRLSKITYNSFFHSVLVYSNDFIVSLFLYKNNYNIAKISDLIPEEQPPKTSEIRTKSSIIYATAYYVSYVATTYLTANPLICDSISISFSHICNIFAKNYMNSFLTDKKDT